MIAVSGTIWLWNEGKGGWYFLTIPAGDAIEIRLQSAAHGPRRGFGSVRVEASINGITWRTSVFPQKSGGYILPVKASVRRAAGIAAGDDIMVELQIL